MITEEIEYTDHSTDGLDEFGPLHTGSARRRSSTSGADVVETLIRNRTGGGLSLARHARDAESHAQSVLRDGELLQVPDRSLFPAMVVGAAYIRFTWLLGHK